MAISGLIMWWPKARKLKSSLTFKFSAKGFIFHRDLHKTLGIWGFIFLIIISFSGVYLAFPKPVGSIIRSAFPARDLKGDNIIIKENNHQKRIALDKIIAIASAKINNQNVAVVFIPPKPNAPYRINFFPENYQKNQPLISVFVNQFDGSVMEIFDPKDYSAGEAIISRLHAIHAGQSFGLIWSIPVFLVAFLPPIFAFTGIKMWLLKRKGRKAAAQI